MVEGTYRALAGEHAQCTYQVVHNTLLVLLIGNISSGTNRRNDFLQKHGGHKQPEEWR